LGLLIVAVAMAWGTWRLTHKWLVRRLLIEMAFWQPTRADEPPTRQNRANPTNLVGWGANMGEPRHEGEDDWAYAKRVFGLSDEELVDSAKP
jgi:hypothetical protein